ncbi:gamma-glutamyl AIG2-like cyclotransferase [Comamonas sp. BIGb0124]|uniref:gamma-glutamylcyclotransferase family protein n=1 Tax=Comamonas sp. BIGb0124 TaxID=2485130 RepID=UPI000F46F8CF|nr:gamma-glutamylcyclotransferase family protein [Comamonas sp. BIGb0124]ROR22742.1 gamma-glutamyl AIG2-like cyclotransferase [Comamonas sp. BIGb0124]
MNLNPSTSEPEPDPAYRPSGQPSVLGGLQDYLFSYGTLQLESVQIATFGRLMHGQTDQLPGYRLGQLRITDPMVLATSGQPVHLMVSYSGEAGDVVEGMVFAVSRDELLNADTYEVADYRRERVTLASGLVAWVYVDARGARRPGP